MAAGEIILHINSTNTTPEAALYVCDIEFIVVTIVSIIMKRDTFTINSIYNSAICISLKHNLSWLCNFKTKSLLLQIKVHILSWIIN